ncbi:MAG: hypothetical protein EXR79_08795 [Myxococcales bacterium]|nr:hypothetical protein [Myxococcales bacterium]
MVRLAPTALPALPASSAPPARVTTTAAAVACALAVATALAVAPPEAWAWSARKVDAPPQPGRRPKPGVRSAPAPKVTAVPIAQAIAALQADGPRASPDRALQLVRRALAEQQRGLAVAAADVLHRLPAVAPGTLLDAATLLGLGQDDPILRKLLQRAWMAARRGALARPVAEAYTDALLAAGDPDAARAVVQAALAAAPRGTRAALFDRLLATARLRGDLDTVLASLKAWHDPDAAVAAARLLQDAGQDEDALATLRAAWKAFPGHRTLQAAWLQLLQRLGLREELAAAVAEVVHLAPADPLPWLQVLDAHILARDEAAARGLIDDLARRFPRHDVLLEGLVDREQRVGDDAKRIQALFRALLDAAPAEAQYAEAYAEWLLSRADDATALEVLGRAGRGEDGKWRALERSAALLLAHGRIDAVRATAAHMQRLRPHEPAVARLYAQLDERSGRLQDAERRWLEVAALGPAPTAPDRVRAAEARQSLAALYRRMGVGPGRARTLAARLENGPLDLSGALLWLDLAGQQENDRSPTSDAQWLQLTQRVLTAFPMDPEVLQLAAVGRVQRDRPAEALAALATLRRLDPDAAEPHLLGLVEAALAQGDAAQTAAAEALLLVPGLDASTSVLLRLGDAHLRFGDPAGAGDLFRRAAAANRTDTRATARLAGFYRLTGAAAEEDRALRDIVLRATDADELDTAGQRLLTVALAAGRSAELVRWLDSVGPQHARREVIERFRLSAYDAWLRTAALDRAVGIDTVAPSPSPVADALASGDLASQVRALRQLSASHRAPPVALARQLLQSPNPVLRRDVGLALGAAGTEGAARLLVEALQQGEADDDVQRAWLVALAALPAVPGEEPALVSLLSRSDTGPLAAWVLARVGSAIALGEMDRQAGALRRDGGVLHLLALGHAAARHAGSRQQAAAVRTLIEVAAGVEAGEADCAREAAAVWALRAAASEAAGAALLGIAVRAKRASLVRMALALFGAPQAPTLDALAVSAGDGEALRDVRGRLVRRTLAPWLTVDRTTLATALQHGDSLIAAALEQAVLGRHDGAMFVARWCGQIADAVPVGSALAARCADAAGAEERRLGSLQQETRPGD